MRWLAAILLLLAVASPVLAESFVTRDGSRLMLEGKPFRFVSVNIPNYFILEDTGDITQPSWHRVTAFEQRDAVRAVQRLGGQVFRAYTFAVEGGRNVEGRMAHIHADPATGRIRYNEDLFRDVDRGLAIAAEEGVRVIIPLVDNWEWFGGYAEWAKLAGAQDFWTDARAKAAFKEFLTWLLNRKNTVNGRRYRDDPAIFAWELGNEIDKANAEWISEMAAHIKRADHNHLLIDGGHKTIPAVSLSDPNIDIVTTHYTDDQFVNFAAQAARAGKAYIYGEFAPTDLQQVSRIVSQTMTSPAAGAMAWSLRFRAESGGFYYHSDFDGKSDSLQYPGFTTNLPKGERQIISVLRQAAFNIRDLPAPPEEAPDAPTMLPMRYPGMLNWQGSAGADGYEVQRAGADGHWQTIASEVTDAKPQMLDDKPIPRISLYRDTPPAGTWRYRVVARNANGESAPSNAVQVIVP
jgi:hypothetical protein